MIKADYNNIIDGSWQLTLKNSIDSEKVSEQFRNFYYAKEKGKTFFINEIENLLNNKTNLNNNEIIFLIAMSIENNLKLYICEETRKKIFIDNMRNSGFYFQNLENAETDEAYKQREEWSIR